jgi:hypothetical protein
VIAPNYHLNEWQPPDAFHLNHLAYSAAKNRARSQAELPSGLQEIHDFLVINASEIMAEIETPLTNEERAYVCQIAQAHLVYALRACRYPVERFVKTEGSLLLTGTGGGFGIRFLSHAFQRNGSPVVRFSHGGVRSLRDDWRWHMIELAFTDTYVVHGRIEAERVRQSVETKTIGMTATGLKIVAAGSKRFGTLLREAAVIQSEGRIHRVMVMASSFLGEQKLAFTSIPEDMVYLDWQIRLLRSLRGGRFRVISNRHPRGQHADAMVFGGYSDEEMIGGRFAEQHQLADAFVLDDAGTALVEALCTMKPVVFVDLPYRPIAAASRVDLEKCCPIIAASFDEENRIVADFDAIRQALDAPVESDARQSFVRDYFTEGEAEIGILERLKTA